MRYRTVAKDEPGNVTGLLQLALCRLRHRRNYLLHKSPMTANMLLSVEDSDGENCEPAIDYIIQIVSSGDGFSAPIASLKIEAGINLMKG
jgi:hypothetical protein